MKVLLICFLLLSCISSVFGQKDSLRTVSPPYNVKIEHFDADGNPRIFWKPGIRIGYEYNKSNFVEVGILEARFVDWNVKVGYTDASLSIGIHDTPGNILLCPKLSYEGTFWLLACKLSLEDYADHLHHDSRISPQIGITYFGFISFFYGYHVPIIGKEFSQIGRNSISVIINLIPYWYKHSGIWEKSTKITPNSF